MNIIIQSLQLLAACYEQQVRAFPPFVHIPDEIVLTFCDAYICVDDFIEEGLITLDQKAALAQMDAFLEEMSTNESQWTLDSLQTSIQWRQVRLLAESLLKSFQVGKQIPDLSWLYFVPTEKDEKTKGLLHHE